MMRRLGKILGLVILLGGMCIGSMAVIGMGPIPTLIDAIACNNDSNIGIAASPVAGQPTSFFVEFNCYDADGDIVRNITNLVMLTGFASIVGGLILGLGMLIGFTEVPADGELEDRFNKFAEDRGMQRVYTGVTAEQLNQSKGDLSTRLEELQKAFDSGLITDEEYQKTRQSILDSMDN